MATKDGIESGAQRAKLTSRREPYWSRIEAGGYVGFRKLPDGGTWIARWRDPHGKQRYRALRLPGADSKGAYDQARKEAQKWFREAASGVVQRGTVAQAAESYLADLKVRKGVSAHLDAKGRIDRHMSQKIGTRPLDSLTTGDLNDWLLSFVPKDGTPEEKRKAKDSANRNLTTLKAMLNHAWKSGLVASDGPWARVKAFSKVARSRTVYLSLAQRRRLLEATQGGFRNLIEAALLTGARYGELRSLKVADFDPEKRLLSIRDGKTGARDVPVSDAAFVLFRRLAKSKLPGAYLLTRDDGQPWAHSDQDELMRDAAKAARLPLGSVFYVLRHTFIASALTAGMDVTTVAKMCGTSLVMIQKHYGKLLQQDAREQLSRIAMV
jgi:integrase